AVAGNRLPPVDLLFDRSPDGRNDALRHRKSTPLRVQEAGAFYRNDKKRKVDDFPFLVVWVRRFELPASGRTAVAGNRLPPVDLLFDRSPDGRNDALRHRKSTPLRVQEAGVFYRNDKKRKVDDFPFLVVWVRRFELPAS
ncbi:MAG: hypothetical protein II590_00625, partial [Clostridia bacterium]|nr:hypothetical protein [Clostridia bacterium]